MSVLSVRRLDRKPRPNGSLSVITPVYNEAHSIEFVIDRVHATGLPREIIVVGDGSTDDTFARLSKLRWGPGLMLVRHKGNRGKGAAIRTGLAYVTGEFVIIPVTGEATRRQK
jgi:glycosyltransferase involved in cell wall biosynthesis